MEILIVYEDSDLVVINKPSGLLSHLVNRTDTGDSVAGWLTEKYPKIKTIGDLLRPGIVHRLDKDTSGLMVTAKTQESFEYLKKLFQDRKIKKTYLALVIGHVKNKSGIIEIPLGKLGTRQSTRIHGKHELKEKPAITEYKVLGYYSLRPTLSTLTSTSYTLLEVFPHTGRTHQIRIHLKSIGHPIVCDPIYGGQPMVCPPGLHRLFLHAQKLSFVSPSGKALAFEVDPPEDLKSFLDNLTKFGKALPATEF